MKNMGVKKLQTSNKPANLVKKSKVQKSVVKNKPLRNKTKKLRYAEANVSIKEKLSGKIFSPTVEKAKNYQQKNVKISSPIANKAKNIQQKKIIENSSPIKPSPDEQKILPAATKKKLKKTKIEVKEEKTVQTKKKPAEHLISEIKKKPKAIIPKVEKTVDVKQDNVKVKDSAGKKRKRNSEKSDLQTKKVKKDVMQSKRIQKKLAKFPERGVCYFSRIPHGFYENELKKYCSQFGEVTGVYHPVSKTGNSRGYAFVEFKHKEVAEVVAETMNNYLMFNRLVKCQYVPPEAQRPWVFKQDRNNMKSAALRRQENLQQQMRNLTKEEVKKWKKRRQTRVKSLHNKLEKLGVDYEFQVNETDENVVQEEKKEEQ